MGIAHALLAELCAGAAWSVEGSRPYTRDFRHWSHWRPSAGMRVLLDVSGAGAPSPADDAP